MFMSCKALGKIPVLAPILMHQLTSTTPYHHQELLLYDSLVKDSLVKNDRLLRPLKETEITECDDLLEKATNKHLKRLLGDEHLSSDEQKELIRLYHLSSSALSPLQNSERATQLANNIQSYINTNLHKEKETLFDKLREEPGSNEEAKANHTRAITQRITDHPILVFATNKYGFTPLHLAAEYGEKESALLLLEAGAEVNATVTAGLYKGCTPLHLATKYGRTDIVEALLQAGADPTVTDSNGQTPLDLAEENTDTAELLHEAGETE